MKISLSADAGDAAYGVAEGATVLFVTVGVCVAGTRVAVGGNGVGVVDAGDGVGVADASIGAGTIETDTVLAGTCGVPFDRPEDNGAVGCAARTMAWLGVGVGGAAAGAGVAVVKIADGD